MSVFICAATATSVLLINFSLTLWASVKYGLHGGLATLQEGSCQKTKELSLWLHLMINILSTILLSASNYCMQCLASPSREEVDQAHRRHVWLDIGVPSVRNLRQVSWFKITLWWLLAISGVPLHLMYNSAVFSSLSSVEYTVYAGSTDLLAGNNIDWSSPIPGSSNTLEVVRNASNWQKLDNQACIEAYGRPFVSARGDLLAVTADVNSSQPVVFISEQGSGADSNFLQSPFAWVCGVGGPSGSTSTCDVNTVLHNTTGWRLAVDPSSNVNVNNSYYGIPTPSVAVDHCLSVPMEERCRLQFSLAIMLIVISCNVMKAVCMLLTLYYHNSQPLVTLGDAVSSFLKHRDPITEEMCLAGKAKFLANDWTKGALTWQPRRHRWFAAASPRRWYICNLL